MLVIERDQRALRQHPRPRILGPLLIDGLIVLFYDDEQLLGHRAGHEETADVPLPKLGFVEAVERPEEVLDLRHRNPRLDGPKELGSEEEADPEHDGDDLGEQTQLGAEAGLELALVGSDLRGRADNRSGPTELSSELQTWRSDEALASDGCELVYWSMASIGVEFGAAGSVFMNCSL